MSSPPALPSHDGKHCAIDAHNTEKIDIKNLLPFVDCVGFGNAQRRNPGVVNYYVDATGDTESLLNSLFRRPVPRDIHFQNVLHCGMRSGPRDPA
jgi:hypothetical protein